MPDPEVTPGTTAAPTGTTPEAGAGGSGDPAGGSESIDAVKTALDEERRKNAQLLSERTRVEEQTRELERQRDELNRRAAAPHQPPTADADMEDLRELNGIVAKFGADTLEGRAAIREARRIMENRQLKGAFAFREQVDRELDNVPEKYRADARKLVLGGGATSVAAAVAQVKAAKSEDEIEALKAKISELEGKVASPPATAPARPAGQTVNVQTAVTSQLDARTARKVPSLVEYQRVMSAGGPEAKALQKDIDEGRVPDPNFLGQGS